MRMFELSPRKTVAILGLGQSIYDWIMANYNAVCDTEVWTVNSGSYTFRHDVVFDMHTEKWLERNKSQEGDSFERIMKRREWMKSHDRPIVMPREMEKYPTSLTYPLRQVVEATNSCYFATSIAYMMAACHVIKPDTVKLFGCDFTYARTHQTHNEPGGACCAYWVGRMLERGIRIELTTNTHFMDMLWRAKGNIYGYDEPCTFEFPLSEDGKILPSIGRFVGPDYGPMPEWLKERNAQLSDAVETGQLTVNPVLPNNGADNADHACL